MSLAGFSAPTRAWFEGTFAAPTPAQVGGWEAIERGGHCLILAPTGSGKTLAAFLWALDRLLTRLPASKAKATTVLYVSPLKALAYDVERNLRAPLAGIARAGELAGTILAPVSVGIRTGDTPQAERRALAKHPPDILVTTPESLYLILTSAARSTLAGVEHVIVDEVHSLAATKRGAHLALSLERLDRLISRTGSARPQRIGLSATQRPLEELARWLGGMAPAAPAPAAPAPAAPAPAAPAPAAPAPAEDNPVPAEDNPVPAEDNPVPGPRPVAIVDAGAPPALDLQVVVPVQDMAQPALPPSAQQGPHPPGGDSDAEQARWPSIWPAIDAAILELIRAHRSTLVFVNSRRLAERLATRLNELAGRDLVRAHHGSIAREQRLAIEDDLKAGRLPALVATSSLELGIDMGAIDLVIQVEAPNSVASGIQRIGRAGHQVGHRSQGRIFPKFRQDLIVAAVCANRMQAGLIEATSIPRNPLDVAAQQVVAMVAAEGAEERLTVDDVAAVVGGAYSFAGLSRQALEGVLDMLSGRYPSDRFAELRPRINWDRLTGVLTPRPGARMLAVVSGGTIPDRGAFGVFTPEGSRVGELDEEMVYECRVGEAFWLGASTWRIVEISRDQVVVVPAPGEPGKMPFWHGDAPGRPYELGKALGAFVGEAEGWSDERLAADCALDPLATANLRAYLADERRATGGVLPTDRNLVVERFRDELGDWRVCILSPLGARVHAPWAMAIEARIRDRLGLEASCIWSDDGIVVRFPEADDCPPVEQILIEPEEVEELVVAEVGRSALFAARFRENAARALLLPRRRPGSRTPLWQLRQRAADLLAVASEHGDFPILLETYRECLSDHFDLAALTALMGDIAARRVRVSSVDTFAPSPFASSLAYSYVSNFIYEGDAPLAERRSAVLTLDRAMLAELVGSDELRSLIDPGALSVLESELACADERHWARNLDEAHDLLRRLGDLTQDELLARCAPGIFGEISPVAPQHQPPLTTVVPERRDGGPCESVVPRDVLLAARGALAVRICGEERLIAPEDAGRYRDALGVQPPLGVPDAFLVPVPDALTQLVRRWARTHGPFVGAEPAARLGVAPERVEAVLVALAAAGTVVSGQFRPDGRTREWCDAGVLARLRERSLAAARREVAPTGVEALARLLPVWQGVGARGGQPLERCWEVLSQLQGVAMPASVVEREVLFARIPGYAPQLLDELLAAGELMWVGAGPLGREDGKVRFFQRDLAGLLLGRLGTPSAAEVPGGPEHERLRGVLAERGACFFRELTLPVAAARPGDDAATLEALWDLVWAGEVTNDGFGALRAATARRPGRAVAAGSRPGGAPGSGSGGAPGSGSGGAPGSWSGGAPGSWSGGAPGSWPGGAPGSWSGGAPSGRMPAGVAGLRRPRLGSLSALGPPRAQGRWSLVGLELSRTAPDRARLDGPGHGSSSQGGQGGSGAGPARATEATAALVRLLLERHGVLTREAVRAEGVPGGFAGVYPVLRAMEEAGRVRRGYFVAGLGGSQFALPGAVDRLRDVREGWGNGSFASAGFPSAAVLPVSPSTVRPATPSALPPAPVSASRLDTLVLASTDPANAYGAALPWPVKGPQRVPGTWVVLVDGLASLYVERGGRGLIALRAWSAPGDPTWESSAVGALDQLLDPGRLHRLVLGRVDPVLEPYLSAAGWLHGPKGLTRYPRRAG
jgi:ATP-dependent Lhr-like helicase